MRARRRIILLFALLQAVGVTCSWLCPEVPSRIGMPMLVVGVFVLMPGNLLGSWVTESLLWNAGLSLVRLEVVSTLLALVANAAAWTAVVKIASAVFARRRTAKDGAARRVSG